MTDHTRKNRKFRLALMAATVGLVASTCSPGFGTLPDQRQARAFEDGEAAGFARHNAPGQGSGDDADRWAGLVTTPSPEPGPPVRLDPVVAQRPKLRLDGWRAPTGDAVAEIMRIEGVAFATAMVLGDVSILAGSDPVPVRVAGVDPAGFRVLTPQVTADAVEVWQRLIEGDAAFTHDVGHRLELPLGTRVPAGERSSLRVGAYASNGVPPVADAIVSKATARQLGINGPPTLLIALTGATTAEAVAKRIEQATGVSPQVLEDPQPRRAFLTGASARKAFEPFSYIDNGDGMIQIDQAWVRRNIVSAKVPIFRGHVICHRLMVPQLRGALQEVQDRGLAHLIDPSQYGGCWVPRHIDFNPAKPLSMHAWGLAVDFNVSTNQLGAIPQMDPRIVEIFDRWGFAWGGRWRRPDGMHFELAALMDASPRG